MALGRWAETTLSETRADGESAQRFRIWLESRLLRSQMSLSVWNFQFLRSWSDETNYPKMPPFVHIPQSVPFAEAAETRGSGFLSPRFLLCRFAHLAFHSANTSRPLFGTYQHPPQSLVMSTVHNTCHVSCGVMLRICFRMAHFRSSRVSECVAGPHFVF